jgi:hypothetical protein
MLYYTLSGQARYPFIFYSQQLGQDPRVMLTPGCTVSPCTQFNCDSFRESCVALVAEGFPCSFNKPTDGLPTEVWGSGGPGPGWLGWL